MSTTKGEDARERDGSPPPGVGSDSPADLAALVRSSAGRWDPLATAPEGSWRPSWADAHVPERPPDLGPVALWRHHRAVPGWASRYPLAILTLILAIDQADRAILGTVFPLIKEEFRLADSALGVVSSAFSVVAAVGGVIFGILTDRYTRTRIVALGTAAWSFAMIATGRAGSFGQLFVARMFLGANEASNNPTSFSLISDYYPVRERGKMLGIFQAGSLVGFFVLPIAGAMADAWGWRTAFYFFAIPGFYLAYLAWRLPEPERGRQDLRHQKLDEGETGARSAYARMGTLRAFLAVAIVPTFLISSLAAFLSTFYLQGLVVWTPTFMVRYHDLSVTQASAAISVIALGAILGTVAGGKLSDWLVLRGVRGARIYLAAVTQMLAAVTLFPAFALPGPFWLFLSLFTIGITVVVIPNPSLNAVMADVIHPDLRGRASVLRSLITTGAGAAAPLAFGLISDATTLRTAFLVSAPALFGGGFLLFLFGARFLAADLDRMRRQLAGEEPPRILRARSDAP